MSMFVKNISREIVNRIDHLVMRVMAEKGVKFVYDSSRDIFAATVLRPMAKLSIFRKKRHGGL